MFFFNFVPAEPLIFITIAYLCTNCSPVHTQLSVEIKIFCSIKHSFFSFWFVCSPPSGFQSVIQRRSASLVKDRKSSPGFVKLRKSSQVHIQQRLFKLFQIIVGRSWRICFYLKCWVLIWEFYLQRGLQINSSFSLYLFCPSFCTSVMEHISVYLLKYCNWKQILGNFYFLLLYTFDFHSSTFWQILHISLNCIYLLTSVLKLLESCQGPQRRSLGDYVNEKHSKTQHIYIIRLLMRNCLQKMKEHTSETLTLPQNDWQGWKYCDQGWQDSR